MGKVYDQVLLFKNKYPGTISWFRVKKHAKVVEEHLNPDEEPLYSMVGQYTPETMDFVSTAVLCLTNKRILIGKDLIIGGYKLNSITPDMFNDMQVFKGILWGKITIDTVKEVVVFTKLDKKCLPEVETAISGFMMEEKKKYGIHERHKDKI